MTGALARMCANHPIRTIIVWVILIVVALVVAGEYLPSATTTNLRLGGQYESERGAAALEKLRGPERLAEIVVVQSPDLTVDDEAFRTKVDEVHTSISALGPEIVSGGLGNNPLLYHYYHAEQLLQGAAALQNFGIAPPFSQEELQQLQALATAAGQEELAAAVMAAPEQAEQVLALAGSPEQSQQLLGILVSPARNTALIHYTMAGGVEEATDNVGGGPPRRRGAERRRRLPGAHRRVGEHGIREQRALRAGPAAGRAVRRAGGAAGAAAALRGGGGDAAAAGAGDHLDPGGAGGCGGHRAGVPAAVLRDGDGRHAGAGGGYRLLAGHRIALQGGDAARTLAARRRRAHGRHGEPDGAVQRGDSGAGAAGAAHRAGVVLPIAGAGRDHRRHRDAGGDADAAAGGADAAGT